MGVPNRSAVHWFWLYNNRGRVCEMYSRKSNGALISTFGVVCTSSAADGIPEDVEAQFARFRRAASRARKAIQADLARLGVPCKVRWKDIGLRLHARLEGGEINLHRYKFTMIELHHDIWACRALYYYARDLKWRVGAGHLEHVHRYVLLRPSPLHTACMNALAYMWPDDPYVKCVHQLAAFVARTDGERADVALACL